MIGITYCDVRGGKKEARGDMRLAHCHTSRQEELQHKSDPSARLKTLMYFSRVIPDLNYLGKTQLK